MIMAVPGSTSGAEPGKQSPFLDISICKQYNAIIIIAKSNILLMKVREVIILHYYNAQTLCI